MTIIKSGQEWTFDLIDKAYKEIETIALEELGLNVFPNQIEIISSEQMIDCYCSNGLPIFYNHWSFGKRFMAHNDLYKHGGTSLAYEIIINSKPAIAYLMEENTMVLQALVIAHACFGHNHFFANNYLFKQWTDPENIIDYLSYAKAFITECEEKYGENKVEQLLDSCHALMVYGIDRYKRPSVLSLEKQKEKEKEREKYIQSQLNDLWRTIPSTYSKLDNTEDSPKKFPSEPQENILRFIEENSPKLKSWERKIINIMCHIAHYFYPLYQTQVQNEGFASYIHHTIMNRLYDKKIIDEGGMMEFITVNGGVVVQRKYNDPHYGGLNPYAFGVEIYKDIERVANNPTDEDYDWFNGQSWVGKGDHMKTIRWAVENFKDDSFIQQFLTPKVMRDFRFFSISDEIDDPLLEVTNVHDKQGYRRIRDILASKYNFSLARPDIQITDVDILGDRTMNLTHNMLNNRHLNMKTVFKTLKHLHYLWKYDLKLNSMNENNKTMMTYQIKDDKESFYTSK